MSGVSSLGRWEGDSLPEKRGFGGHPRMGILTLTYPIVAGLCTNFDDLEKVLFDVLYNQLRRAPEEHPLGVVLLQEWDKHRALLEKLTQIAFETYNVPALLLLPADVAAAAAVHFQNSGGGATSSPAAVLVLHSGFDVSLASVVVDGRSELASHSRRDIGGGHVTGALVELLRPRAPADAGLDTRAGMGRIADASRLACYVAPAPIEQWRAAYAKNPVTRPFELISYGDVLTLSLGAELFEATEILFSNAAANLVDLCLECLAKSRHAVTSLVLAGGNTQWPGLAARLELELARRGRHVAVLNRTGDRAHLAYEGLSRFAASSSVQWLSIDAYNDVGPTAIHQFWDAFFI